MGHELYDVQIRFNQRMDGLERRRMFSPGTYRIIARLPGRIRLRMQEARFHVADVGRSGRRDRAGLA